MIDLKVRSFAHAEPYIEDFLYWVQFLFSVNVATCSMCKSSFPSVMELNAHISHFMRTGFCEKNYIGSPPTSTKKQKGLSPLPVQKEKVPLPRVVQKPKRTPSPPIHKQKVSMTKPKAGPSPQKNPLPVPVPVPAQKNLGPPVKRIKRQEEQVKRPRDPSHRGTCSFCKQGKCESYFQCRKSIGFFSVVSHQGKHTCTDN